MTKKTNPFGLVFFLLCCDILRFERRDVIIAIVASAIGTHFSPFVCDYNICRFRGAPM